MPKPPNRMLIVWAFFCCQFGVVALVMIATNQDYHRDILALFRVIGFYGVVEFIHQAKLAFLWDKHLKDNSNG